MGDGDTVKERGKKEQKSKKSASGTERQEVSRSCARGNVEALGHWIPCPAWCCDVADEPTWKPRPSYIAAITLPLDLHPPRQANYSPPTEPSEFNGTDNERPGTVSRQHYY